MQLDLKLSTIDAPNACSVLFDVIRGTKIAIDKGMYGPNNALSAYAFKHPPKILPFKTAKRLFKDFVMNRNEFYA